jgi:hypothetical protein
MAKEQEFASAERLAAEGGIVSDEGAVAEPEIETNEGLVKKFELEPAESAAAVGDRGEAVCPITMGSQRCGRKLHVAPDGVDEYSVCLMHSKDPHKQSGPLFGAFWREFERILADAGEGEAHFEYFVIPKFYFGTRIFKAICHFNSATFTGYAIFSKARFMQNAIFSGATFTQEADFSNANFTQDALFIGTTFTLATNYSSTKFQGTAVWHDTRFLDRAEFRSTKFEPQIKDEPSAVFTLTKFSKPGEVVFDGVDLSHVLFHNSDVSQVWFTSSVKWARRKNNRGLAIFDEIILHEQEFTDTLLLLYEPFEYMYESFDYRAVAQVYRQLKKNYDSRLDYWTANEFHYGEMEMKRLAGPTYGPLLWLRRWWHRNLSFVAWYKYASDYGNSYRKPLAWLLGTLLAAALLFPIHGLELKQPTTGNAASSASVTYSRVWNQQESWTNNFWTEAKLIGKSGITAIDTATFQRTSEYTPVYPWGRVLAIVETLLTSSLFALFLLAIRRQFRR